MEKLGIGSTIAFTAMFAAPGDQAEAGSRKRSVSLEGVTPILAAKAREIEATCGSVIISAIAKRPIRSNHPIGRAVDVEGNPGCVYALLKDLAGRLFHRLFSGASRPHQLQPRRPGVGIRSAHGQHHDHHGVRHAESGSMSYASHGADPTGNTW